MTKRRVRDERQAELFCLPEPPPPPVKVVRQPKRPTVVDAAPEPEVETAIEERIARLTQREVEDLARGLPDEHLAHVALASARELLRRLGRGSAQRRPRSARGSTPIEHAVRQIAAALAEGAPSDEW